jgi:hypothetical protein
MAEAGRGTVTILRHFYSGLIPTRDHEFLPDAVDVGLGWERSTVTLEAERYRLRSPGGVVDRGRLGELTFVPFGGYVRVTG